MAMKRTFLLRYCTGNPSPHAAAVGYECGGSLGKSWAIEIRVVRCNVNWWGRGCRFLPHVLFVGGCTSGMSVAFPLSVLFLYVTFSFS